LNLKLLINLQHFKSQSSVSGVFLLVVLSLVFFTTITTIGPTTLAVAQANGTDVNSLYPIESKPFGKSYGEWSAKWWQWAVSVPTNKNPLKDSTGVNCAQGQEGPVWFLAGTFGGVAERTCTIPSGKAIMFPVFNAECSYVEYPQYRTESDLRNCAKDQLDKSTNLDASVDGVKIENLKQYRAVSPQFDLILPNSNVFGLTSGTTQSVADGFWIILQPLPAGKHEVRFSGSSVDFTSSGVMNFATEAKYQLNVQ
jgi:hypothetical protein